MESRESIATFLDMGIELPQLHLVDFMIFYFSMLVDKDRQHFGVFHGHKILAYACYVEAFDPYDDNVKSWSFRTSEGLSIISFYF